MRLYHYLEAKWALDDIRRRRLKLSKIDDMNDPWERRSVYSNDEFTQETIEDSAERMCERLGVACFGRSWNNILMWSHYGDRHKGICLGFNVPDDATREIRYVAVVEVVGKLIGLSRPEKAAEGARIISKLFETKYSGWEYEEEVRVHGRREEKDEETGLYFLPFSDGIRLKEVIAGPRYPMSKKPIEEALKSYSEDVKILKATTSHTGFEIVIDQRGFDGGVPEDPRKSAQSS